MAQNFFSWRLATDVKGNFSLAALTMEQQAVATVIDCDSKQIEIYGGKTIQSWYNENPGRK